jgi:hypothetical protein
MNENWIYMYICAYTYIYILIFAETYNIYTYLGRVGFKWMIGAGSIDHQHSVEHNMCKTLSLDSHHHK